MDIVTLMRLGIIKITGDGEGNEGEGEGREVDWESTEVIISERTGIGDKRC